MKNDNAFKYFSLATTWIWLIIFSFVPYGLVIFASLMSHDTNHLIRLPFTLQNYVELSEPIYIKIFIKSFYIAGISTLICLILGYPFAYTLARMKSRLKGLFILLVIIPFWTSSLIRSYSMIAILKAKGIINSLLLSLGIIHEPIPMIFNNTSVIIGLVYNLLPFMILPLMTNIERLDNRLIDAARDLGANRITTFRKIILPLTMPGMIAGCILVFLPAMTLFYIPDLLGGAKSILLGNLIQNQFLITQHWPLGSATSIVLAILLAVMILIYLQSKRNKKEQDLL
ncbi:spermidine/putrescine ABC transporter permease [Gammaproteobacteria bacterium SCGC AG-212-F23]|nr:spermidine/putrescine ABC transporter permease [Gammaproteobacteria bacterium SCGC AG-212-F23]